MQKVLRNKGAVSVCELLGYTSWATQFGQHNLGSSPAPAMTVLTTELTTASPMAGMLCEARLMAACILPPAAPLLLPSPAMPATALIRGDESSELQLLGKCAVPEPVLGSSPAVFGTWDAWASLNAW